MIAFRSRRARAGRHALVVGLALFVCLTGCGDRQTGASPSVPDATMTPFPYSDEPIAIEPGTYRIPRSAWSVADFTVTIPADWTVQYGHVYANPSDVHGETSDELGFYAVVIDAIYTDPCEGPGELRDVGPGVDDLAAALLRQPGPKASGPVETTLGGYPATRIDLSVPESLDLESCRLASYGALGLQIWYSPPADKYFVLLPDSPASVYIVDVDGQRQVFLSYRAATSDEDLRELQAVLDSIQIET